MHSSVRKCESIPSDEFRLVSRFLPIELIKQQRFSISCSSVFLRRWRIHRCLASSDIVPTPNNSLIKVIFPNTLRRFDQQDLEALWSILFFYIQFQRCGFQLFLVEAKLSLSNSSLQWASCKVRKDKLFPHRLKTTPFDSLFLQRLTHYCVSRSKTGLTDCLFKEKFYHTWQSLLIVDG